METDWEEHYRADFTPWDKGAAAPPLIEWLSRQPEHLAGPVLVPGCGTGHDVRALAASMPAAEIIGLDLAPTALEKAEKFTRAGRESYRLGDLLALPEDLRGVFSLVWEHTCFCAIDPAKRDDYVRGVFDALASRGALLAVFYLDPYDDEHQPGGGPPHGATIEELEARFVGSGLFSIREAYVPAISYPGREGLEYFMRFDKNR